jgi:hypothetical protein
VGKESFPELRSAFLKESLAKNFPELRSCVQESHYKEQHPTAVIESAAGYCKRTVICCLAPAATYFLLKEKVGKENFPELRSAFLKESLAKNFPELRSCVPKSFCKGLQTAVVIAGAA